MRPHLPTEGIPRNNPAKPANGEPIIADFCERELREYEFVVKFVYFDNHRQSPDNTNAAQYLGGVRFGKSTLSVRETPRTDSGWLGIHRFSIQS